MDAHEIADALHREADEILYRRGVDAILQSFGRVHYTGSYALNLMAWPDIDITMVLDGDPYSFDNFFEMGKQLAAVEGVDKIEYWNSLNWDVANLPKGLYWGVRCKTATREVPWKIDVWATNEADAHPRRSHPAGQRVLHLRGGALQGAARRAGYPRIP